MLDNYIPNSKSSSLGNNVEYFVSYYDYYQPEAYVPSTDTYIEKDSSINDEIDELRHAATSALITYKDTIVVSSVSCIYGIGEVEEYKSKMLTLSQGYWQQAIATDIPPDRPMYPPARVAMAAPNDAPELMPMM